MKKLISILVLLIFFAACNSNNNTAPSTKTSPDSTGGAAPNMPAVDNVNGNVPDTTIKLNKPLPKDSSRVNDSVRH